MISRTSAPSGSIHGLSWWPRNLAHVFDICDRISVMKTGIVAGTRHVSETNREEILRLIRHGTGSLMTPVSRSEIREAGDLRLGIHQHGAGGASASFGSMARKPFGQVSLVKSTGWVVRPAPCAHLERLQKSW